MFFKEVKNNVPGAIKVLAEVSGAPRFALFPGCYDEERNAWKGVECYENGYVDVAEVWFTKCFLLKATGEKVLVGYIPHFNAWLRNHGTFLIPLWHNAEGYSQYKGTNAKRVYGVITNTGADDDIIIRVKNGAFQFECEGFQSDDVCTSSGGNACVRVPERQYSVIFPGKTVKYKKLTILTEDEFNEETEK